MPLIECPECGKQVSDKAPSCPNCGVPIAQQAPAPPPATAPPQKRNTSCLAGGCLVLLVLFLIGVISSEMKGPSTSSSSSSSESQSTYTPPSPAPPEGPKLALLSSSGIESETGSYYYIQGQVKNISSEPLKSVMAVGTWLDDSGGFIKSDDALIDYNPILPGQTSPFKVISTGNPRMSKYRVEFKTLFGGTLDYEDQRKTSRKKRPANSQ
jgi:hypothetical protein